MSNIIFTEFFATNNKVYSSYIKCKFYNDYIFEFDVNHLITKSSRKFIPSSSQTGNLIIKNENEGIVISLCPSRYIQGAP